MDGSKHRFDFATESLCPRTSKTPRWRKADWPVRPTDVEEATNVGMSAVEKDTTYAYTSTLLARLLVEGCSTLSQVSIGDLSEGPGIYIAYIYIDPRSATPNVTLPAPCSVWESNYAQRRLPPQRLPRPWSWFP